ncbi:MAG: hypothetical protein AAF620_14220 [Bacteroidota bacterium]
MEQNGKKVDRKQRLLGCFNKTHKLIKAEVKQGTKHKVIMHEFEPSCYWRDEIKKGQIEFSKATLLQETDKENIKVAGSFYYQPETSDNNDEYAELVFILPEYLEYENSMETSYCPDFNKYQATGCVYNLKDGVPWERLRNIWMFTFGSVLLKWKNEKGFYCFSLMYVQHSLRCPPFRLYKQR